MKSWPLRLSYARCFGALVLLCGLCGTATGWAADIDAQPSQEAPPATGHPAPKPLRQRFKESRDLYEATVTNPTSHAGTVQTVPTVRRQDLILSIIILGLGAVAVRRLAPEFTGVLGSAPGPATGADGAPARSAAEVLAEEECVSSFLAAFRIGPKLVPFTPSGPGDSSPAAPAAEADTSIFVVTPLKAFLASAPTRLLAMRKSLQEICRVQEEAERKGLLGALGAELRAFKGMAGLPELLPVWQLAYALECLVKQLTDKPSRMSASTLRTVAATVDLLEELGRPGLRSDLCTNPPIRTLAVDDEPISRHAVAFALKKGVGAPDVAENGPAALELAGKQHYDVLFLDVQMPGMDGFELCSRIHETESNRTTPVVFVTVHSDFGARAKSTLCGGNDLIGKPFLTFEITVKALTLALRSRLHPDDSSSSIPDRTVRGETSPAPMPRVDTTTIDVPPAAIPAPASSREAYRVAGLPPAWTPPAAIKQTQPPAANPSAGAFFTDAPVQLEKARELIRAARDAMAEPERQEALANLYLVIHSVSPAEDWAALRPVFRLTLALKGLLKKLLERPGNLTESALPTVVSAVDLLQDLSAKPVMPDLASTPPVRMLVVDDDPIARRAMAGALQIAFGRPESAADGEAALALAEKKAYDVIFLDVLMPGMDGFAACQKIHGTAANCVTPVIFVTSNGDSKARHQSALSGGSDFIAKPFLAQEITLKALTFALRRRLQARDSTTPAVTQEQAILTPCL